MTALIVGGDYVESLKREIVAHGHADVEHWSGRKIGFTRRTIPDHAQLIVVLCDYVNHNLAIGLKRQARRSGAALLFCRHSVNDLRRKLDEMAGAGPGDSKDEGDG
jgi:hypothetical protein